ncbi:GGDEF domain-containing protein [Paenibacillus senegalimassiliensis]|uniref:GGDEF domain-containing protein n=1 Tax=Paenibacillus senegalimassiliensis TaxID=1737426 RepID=UPI00073F5A07|nr:diguanylate cyclase [Paenibacillus senegalimassiliensis]
MLQDLFNNFMLLTTFIYLGHIVRSKVLSRSENTAYTRLLLGVVLGVLGVLLMNYTFPLSSRAVADFRQLPILISISLGGGVSGVITTAIIGLYRLNYLQGVAGSSLIGALHAPITLLCGLIILRGKTITFKRWLVALVLSALNTGILLSILLEPGSWKDIAVYMLLLLIAGIFIYLMISHLRKAEDSVQMMEEAANRDFLTSLFNSRAFEVIIEQKIAVAKRDHIPFTLLIVDIDYFKHVNDTYGHPAGDAVLRQFADVLRETFRPGDQISRKGGEEFFILVDRCSALQITAIAERLRSTVEQHRFILDDGEELQLTISAGSATYPDIPGEQLVTKADQALYQAKEAGRNRVYRAE